MFAHGRSASPAIGESGILLTKLNLGVDVVNSWKTRTILRMLVGVSDGELDQ